MTDYTGLLEYCATARQRQVIETLLVEGTFGKAAKKLNCARSSIGDVVARVRSQAERRLYSPEHNLTNPVPPGFTGDFTIQQDGEGNVERTWMKGKLDRANQHQQYLNFIEGLNSEIVPAKRTRIPDDPTNHLIASAIVIGDAHLGMLAHGAETLSDDHNLDTAVADLMAGIDYLVARAFPSEQGWFVNVGDFMHADNSAGTTASGTGLDTSARQYAVMKAAGKVQRYAIDRMLTKFRKVLVVNARGNHDRDSAFALNMYVQAVYENEPRVEVLGNDAKYTFIEWGKCLIGVNHGDDINPLRLAGVMTRMAAEAWGRTLFRRWWVGHIHHKQKNEHDTGVTIQSFHTLAPVDYWHSAHGYGAERRITMITLHKEYGEVDEICPPLQLIRDYYVTKSA